MGNEPCYFDSVSVFGTCVPTVSLVLLAFLMILLVMFGFLVSGFLQLRQNERRTLELEARCWLLELKSHTGDGSTLTEFNRWKREDKQRCEAVQQAIELHKLQMSDILTANFAVEPEGTPAATEAAAEATGLSPHEVRRDDEEETKDKTQASSGGPLLPPAPTP